MKTIISVLTIFLGAATSPLGAHIRSIVQSTEAPLQRTDANNIQFRVNEQTQAGMLNTGGQPIITAGSNPMAALQASADRWSAVSSAMISFAQLQTTPLSNDGMDGNHVITFQDTPAIRSTVGGALAIAAQRFTVNGNIIDSDILFNPDVQIGGQHFAFSTNLEAGTFDLGSVATHELGHTLGSAHSGVIAATMFPRAARESDLHATLSGDDLAFARAVYPAGNVAADFGHIEGTISRAAGGAVRRVLVTAHGQNGTVVCALTNPANGAYRIGPLPPGNYFVSAEPVDGPLSTGDLGAFNASTFDLDIKVGFFGGDNPATVSVSAGQTTMTSFSVNSGAPALSISRIGQSGANTPGAFRNFGAGAIEVDPMTSFDLVMDGTGVDASVQPTFLGPGLTLQAGSVKVDPFIQGITLVRMTLNVGAVNGRQLASIALAKGGEITDYAGSIVIKGVAGAGGPIFTNAGLGNGASLATGAVAADEIVSLFGQNLAGQQASGPEPLPTQLAGTTVEVRDSQGVTRLAGISFIHPLQMNFVIPAGTALGQATLTVRTAQGSATINLQVDNVSPGIFTPNGTGEGVAFAQRWLFNNDFSQLVNIANAYQLSGNTFVPAPINLGPQNQQPVLVLATTGLRRASVVTATIGGQAAQVLGVAAQGQFTGLDQVNILLNRNLAGRGTVNVVLTVDGKATKPTTVAFQ